MIGSINITGLSDHEVTSIISVNSPVNPNAHIVFGYFCEKSGIHVAVSETDSDLLLFPYLAP